METDSKVLHKNSDNASLALKDSDKNKKQRRNLVPDDPAQYGIVIRSKADQPRSEEEWGLYLENKIKKSGVLESKKAEEVFVNIQKTPEAYDQRINEIDARINHFEEIKNTNPSDTEAERHLQKLYQLKAIGKTLAPKVIKLVPADEKTSLNTDPQSQPSPEK